MNDHYPLKTLLNEKIQHANYFSTHNCKVSFLTIHLPKNHIYKISINLITGLSSFSGEKNRMQ